MMAENSPTKAQTKVEVAPSRHLMALLTFVWLLQLVYFIPPAVDGWLPGQRELNVLISVGAIVPMISYLLLPLSLWLRRLLTSRVS